MGSMNSLSPIGRGLVEAELFDLTLYERMRPYASSEMVGVLEELIAVEKRHLSFWRGMFPDSADLKLGFSGHTKLFCMLALARVFGDSGIHILIEAIEVHGIQHYLALWEMHEGDEFGRAIAPILKDELGHEEVIVSSGNRKIHPERIRDLFLGFNDGLVEVVGASSGFYAAFGTASAVLLAGMSVAVAGALSMAAGAYAAVGSASEMENLELHRRRFLGESMPEDGKGSPFMSALVVGVSYFIGALVPLVPVFFGAENLWLSVIVSVLAAVVISYVVAFFSGMHVARRIGINLASVALAVGVTYGIGIAAKAFLGVAL